MTTTFFFDVAGAMAVTALLAEVYGIVRRKFGGSRVAPFVLGVVFGLIAMVQMHNPIEPYSGLIVDLRNIPIALAGAFLGWRGLLPCLALAMMTRLSIGGVGMESGLWGMVISGGAGMLWAWKMTGPTGRSFTGFVLLGLAMSSHLFAAVVLPHDIAMWFLTTAALPMLMLNLITVPLIAALLERENARIRRENHLVASATHDPVSGLLLAPAFLREMNNAYAARAFGTYAGYLTITPERGIWRATVGLFGDIAPAPVDRQTLSLHLAHADLAGLCADGRVLVPLTTEEVHHFSRLKANLALALRCTSEAASATDVSLSMESVPDPAEFLRIAATAPVKGEISWPKHPVRHPPRAPRVHRVNTARRVSIFDRENHDLLFAKADFLIQRRRRFSR